MPRMYHQGGTSAINTQTDGLSSKDTTWGKPMKLTTRKLSRPALGIEGTYFGKSFWQPFRAKRVGGHGSTDPVCVPPGATYPSSSDFTVV